MRKRTIEEFIEKSKQVHNNKYNYDFVTEFSEASPIVIITCPVHGNFPQNYKAHYKGFGCDRCAKVESGNKKRKSNEKFIEEARRVHGDLYDYSLVEYKKNTTDVSIICKLHGEFHQSPKTHLKGCRCNFCLNEFTPDPNGYNLKKFIEKAKKIHGDRYDYSLVELKKGKENILIICKEHGVFKQTPINHLKGCNCKDCSSEISGGKRTNPQHVFIKKAKEKHGDKYDYSLVEYKNTRSEVDIICPIHGLVPQKPQDHLRSGGCRYCGMVDSAKKLTRTQEEFVSQAKAVHGDKYDYTNTVYVNAKNKVQIFCPIHKKPFEQLPTPHLNGAGCPDCAEYGNDYTKSSWVRRAGDKLGIFYILRCYNETESFYKFGITFNTLKMRYCSKTRMPYKYEIVRMVMSSDKGYIWDLEKKFRRWKLKDKCVPLIYFDGCNTECFSHYHHNPTPAGAIVVVDAPKKPIYIQMQLDFAC